MKSALASFAFPVHKINATAAATTFPHDRPFTHKAKDVLSYDRGKAV